MVTVFRGLSVIGHHERECAAATFLLAADFLCQGQNVTFRFGFSAIDHQSFAIAGNTHSVIGAWRGSIALISPESSIMELRLTRESFSQRILFKMSIECRFFSNSMVRSPDRFTHCLHSSGNPPLCSRGRAIATVSGPGLFPPPLPEAAPPFVSNWKGGS